MPRKPTAKKTKIEASKFELPTEGSELYEAIEQDNLEFLLIRGSLYEHLGLSAGDFVLCHPTSKLVEDRLTIWAIPGRNYLSIGYAFDNFGDISIYTNENDLQRYKKSNVSLRGVIVGVLKGHKGQNTSDLQTERDLTEVTLVCSKCQKEMTGNKKFLIAQGWEFKNGEWTCLNCDLFD